MSLSSLKRQPPLTKHQDVPGSGLGGLRRSLSTGHTVTAHLTPGGRDCPHLQPGQRGLESKRKCTRPPSHKGCQPSVYMQPLVRHQPPAGHQVGPPAPRQGQAQWAQESGPGSGIVLEQRSHQSSPHSTKARLLFNPERSFSLEK